MRDKIRSLTKASVIYGLGHVLGRLVTFLLLPYYTYRISPAEYGEVTLYFVFIAAVQTFYLYGLDISYLRYFNLAKEETNRRRVSGVSLQAAVVTTLLISALLFLFRDACGSLLIDHPLHPDEVPLLISACIGILAFDTLSTFPFLWLRSKNRPVHFITQKLINVTINIALNVWWVGGLQWGVKGILFANLAASGITCLLLMPAMLREVDWNWDRAQFKDMLLFGLPNVPTYFAVMIVELASRKFVEVYHGAATAGLFSAGYKLGMFMSVINAAFRFAWQPFFLKHATDDDAPRMFARVMTYYLLMACSLTLVLTVIVAPLVKSDLPLLGRLIAPEYWPGLSVFPLILAAHIFDGVYANLMVGVYVKKESRRLPVVTGVAALITIVLNILLVPRFGMMAAAWITVVAFFVQAALLYVATRSLYPIPYEWRRIALILISCGVLTSLAATWADSRPALGMGLIAAWPLLLWAFGFFTPAERGFLRNLIAAR